MPQPVGRPSSSSGGGGEAVRLSAGGAGDNDLESALDRLSLSLERIQDLLLELHGARQSRRKDAAHGASRQMQPFPAAEHARVIHGGGPSVFSRR